MKKRKIKAYIDTDKVEIEGPKVIKDKDKIQEAKQKVRRDLVESIQKSLGSRLTNVEPGSQEEEDLLRRIEAFRGGK